jgi:hypothetical protein
MQTSRGTSVPSALLTREDGRLPSLLTKLLSHIGIAADHLSGVVIYASVFGDKLEVRNSAPRRSR